MKKIFLYFVFLLLSFRLLAQRDSIHASGDYSGNYYFSGNNKFCLSFNMGAGIPMQDYGDISQTPFSSIDTTHITGLATTGFHFNLNASYLFSRFFGATLMIGGTLNSFDAEQWQALRNAAVADIATSVSGSFYIGEYLIGPYASLPVSNKVQIEFKALFGVLTANYPVLTQTYPSNYSVNIPNYTYGIPLTQEKTLTNAVAFGYYFGTGIKYLATNHIGLHVNVGYTGSDVGYPDVLVTYYQNGNLIYTAYGIHSRYMPLGIFQPTAGISYNW